MVARAGDHSIRLGKPFAPINWLEQVDRRVSELAAGSDWLKDSELARQRCRRFIMARFTELPSPLAQSVLSRELSRGERQIRESEHAERVLRGLRPGQGSQLAGLFLDIIEALQVHARHRQSSKKVQELAAEADRRTRMLCRRVSSIRRKLESLQIYAEGLDPSLSLNYFRAATRCLKILASLKEDGSAGEFYRSLKPEYPTLEDPWQLGLVQLYWFFRHECRCSGRDSEVRVAMIANDLLAGPGRRKLRYIPKYRDAVSQGCSAVRLAVSRYHPRTKN